MRARTHMLSGEGNNRRTFMLTFAVSLICHLVFFGSVVFAPGLKPERKYTPAVINVSMVSFPTAAKTPNPEVKIEEKPSDQPIEPQKPEKQVVIEERAEEPIEVQEKPLVEKPRTETDISAAPKPTEAVSLTPKKKIKTSLKKKTFKPSRVVKSAITRIQKKVEASKPDKLATAIGRLKQEVEKTTADREKKQAVKRESEAEPIKGGGSRFAGKKTSDQILIYQQNIAYRVEKNWAFSKQLAGGRTDLMVELAFTIMPTGEIKDIWFDKRSGNSYFDDSAKKAVLKSNPLPPLPKGHLRPITVGLRFTPSGLR
jgi:colicin import membrane protein